MPPGVIKICASGGVLSEADPVDVPQLTPDELTAIIGEAHKWKRKVAAHAHGDIAARQAVEAGIDSIEHGSFLTESTLKLMKAKGVYLVPTRMAVYWTKKRLTPENLEFLKELPRGPVSPMEGVQCVHGSARDEDEYVVVAREAYPRCAAEIAASD